MLCEMSALPTLTTTRRRASALKVGRGWCVGPRAYQRRNDARYPTLFSGVNAQHSHAKSRQVGIAECAFRHYSAHPHHQQRLEPCSLLLIRIESLLLACFRIHNQMFCLRRAREAQPSFPHRCWRASHNGSSASGRNPWPPGRMRRQQCRLHNIRNT
jgi:hypothetical protein